MYKIIILSIFVLLVVFLSMSCVQADNKTSTDISLAIQSFNEALLKPVPPLVFSGEAAVREANQDRRVHISQDRRKMMLEVALEHPEIFLQNVLPKDVKKGLPQDVLENIEKEVVFSGIIDSVRVDAFDSTHNQSSSHALFYTNGKIMRLSSPQDTIRFKKDTPHTIVGYELGDVLVGYPQGGDVEASPRNVSHSDSLGDQKTLVFLVTFPDASTVPFTKQQVSDLIFTGHVQKYFHEASHGKISWSGDVLDWVTIPKQKVTNPCFSVMLNDLLKDNPLYMVPEMQQVIADNNVDISQYGRILYIINSKNSSGCSSLGKSSVSVNGVKHLISETWLGVNSDSMKSFSKELTMNLFDVVLIHELGHALGLDHAEGLDCGKETLSDECVSVEYGNPFDIMGWSGRGSALFSKHFNGYYKSLLGWLDLDEQREITEPGVYRLSPVEGTSGIRYLTVVNPTVASRGLKTQAYAVEFRQPIGYDSTLSQSETISQTKGVFIHQINPSDQSSKLIDVNPTSDEWNIDVKKSALTSGTFFDKEQGIIIGPISKVTTTGVDISVRFQDTTLCENVPLKVVIPSKQNNTYAGHVAYLSLKIINPSKKTCGAAPYSIHINSPISHISFATAEINGTPRNLEALSVEPKEKQYALVGLTTSDVLEGGVYPITITVKNLFNNKSTIVSYPVSIIPKPFIHSVNPDRGLPGSQIFVKGSGFLKKNNQVIIRGNQTQFVISDLKSNDGKTLSFPFPKKVYKIDGTKALSIPVKGIYTMQVYNDYLYSSSTSFLVE